jgi:WD40 repeat protein
LWGTISGAHLNTLKGHLDHVISIASSPDGMRVASGSNDHNLRLWDTVSGAHVNTLKGHLESVISIAFSPDGTRVVSGSYDNTIRLWDTVSGAHLHTLKGHFSAVESVAFSPDGMRVVSVSHDMTLRLWDAASGAHLHRLEGRSSLIESVAFSSDRRRVVSRPNDNTLELWDAVNGVHLDTFCGEPMIFPYIAHLVAHSLHAGQSSFSQGVAQHIDIQVVSSSNKTSQWIRYIVDADGWLCSAYPKRRICWLPVSCRTQNLTSHGNIIAMGVADGRVVILNFKDLNLVVTADSKNLV